MPAKNAKGRSGGFSADERAAMKARAAELRAEGKNGVKKADGLQAVAEAIAVIPTAATNPVPANSCPASARLRRSS